MQVHKREPQRRRRCLHVPRRRQDQGLAVIASEPREFTIVNIIGSIDIDKIAKLEGQFGIPKVSQNQ